MNRNPLLIIAILMIAFPSLAQIRHVKGIKSIEAGYGVNEAGSIYYGGYVMYFSNKLYGKASAFYGTGTAKIEEGKYRMQTAGLDITPVFTLKPVGDLLYLNLRGGATLEHDQLNPKRIVVAADFTTSEKDYSVLKYGLVLGAEPEFFLSDKFVLVLGWTYRYTFGKKTTTSTGEDYTLFGTIRYYGSVGIRYNF